MEPDQINLDKRKLINETNSDFVAFMNDKVSSQEIRFNMDYDKTSLHEEFLDNYPEYRSDNWLRKTGNFTRYLKAYSKYSTDLRSTIKERRSNSRSFIQFTNIDIKQTELPF
jgi:hypothetical protein